jgi:hypothetical protein
MFSRKKLYLLALVVVGLWTYYMFVNKEYFIQEHLTNNNPTLFSLQSDLDTTNTNLSSLQTQVQKMIEQGQAQASQAAAAKASLEAIPTGSNNIIPTS